MAARTVRRASREAAAPLPVARTPDADGGSSGSRSLPPPARPDQAVARAAADTLAWLSKVDGLIAAKQSHYLSRMRELELEAALPANQRCTLRQARVRTLAGQQLDDIRELMALVRDTLDQLPPQLRRMAARDGSNAGVSAAASAACAGKAAASFIDSLPSVEQTGACSALDCPICLADLYEQSEERLEVVALPCQGNHCFHRPCIRNWAEVAACCPLCRECFVTSPLESEAQPLAAPSVEPVAEAAPDVAVSEDAMLPHELGIRRPPQVPVAPRPCAQADRNSAQASGYRPAETGRSRGGARSPSLGIVGREVVRREVTPSPPVCRPPPRRRPSYGTPRSSVPLVQPLSGVAAVRLERSDIRARRARSDIAACAQGRVAPAPCAALLPRAPSALAQ